MWSGVLAVVLLVCAVSAARARPGDPTVASAAAAEPGPVVAAADAAPAPAAARRRLVIHAAGDVSLDPGYVPSLRARGFDYAWSGLDGLFADDDLTVVNLECPVSTRGTQVPDKQFHFRCDPAALPAARAAGVEVANLANNHSGDYGPLAQLDSVGYVRDAGIAPVGVGADRVAANTPAIIERGGWRIAVLGFGGVIPDPAWLAGAHRSGMADGDDTAAMTAAIRAAHEQADLVFVTIHWGVELDTTPRPDDVARAHAMIDAGADGVFGHHAHRLQPMQTYKGRPIAWGLGNFVWPTQGADATRTAVAEVVVEPDGAVRGCLLPARIAAPGHPVLTGERSCPT